MSKWRCNTKLKKVPNKYLLYSLNTIFFPFLLRIQDVVNCREQDNVM